MAYTGRSFQYHSRNKSINSALEWLSHRGTADHPVRRWQNGLARSTLAHHVLQFTALEPLRHSFAGGAGQCLVSRGGGRDQRDPGRGLLLGPYMPQDVVLGVASPIKTGWLDCCFMS